MRGDGLDMKMNLCVGGVRLVVAVFKASKRSS